MKEILNKLLLEEYRQISLFSDLEKRGVDITHLVVNNTDIVYDLIGFPKGNAMDYDPNVLYKLRSDGKKGIKLDDHQFSRDWLDRKYYDVINSIEKIQKIEVCDKGLKLTEYDDENLIKEKLNEFIDWLYQEYDKLKYMGK